jgi:hypothetical protein
MKTILIIDDDMHIGDMLQEVLEREGYGVLRAYSGTEALMLLALALMMGGMAIYQMLSAPEFLSGPATIVNGVLMPSPEPVANPKYLTGAKRTFFQFLHDFLPGGQTVTIGMTGELPEGVWRLPVFSALLTLLSTLGGAWGFCRRDLK